MRNKYSTPSLSIYKAETEAYLMAASGQGMAVRDEDFDSEFMEALTRGGVGGFDEADLLPFPLP